MDKERKELKKTLDKMVKENKISCIVDKTGQKYYFLGDGGIVDCPKCNYPMEFKQEFNCSNCKTFYKLISKAE